MNKIAFLIVGLMSVAALGFDIPEGVSMPNMPSLEELKELHQKSLADDKLGSVECASTTLAGEVYIATEDKSLLFCSIDNVDWWILPSTTEYNMQLAQCKWSMYYCTTSGDNVYVYFRHYDSNNLIKYLACFRAQGQSYCWQYEIGNPGEDTGLGHIFRLDTASGFTTAKNLYNYYSGYYAKFDDVNYMLTMTSNAQTVFRVCFVNPGLSYC